MAGHSLSSELRSRFSPLGGIKPMPELLWERRKLAVVATLIQTVLTALMIRYVKYGPHASTEDYFLRHIDERLNPIESHIAMFQDVNVMIFVGFGFLMTFLKHYGYGAVGLTLLCSAFATQTSLLIRGVFERNIDGYIGTDGYIGIEVTSLLSGLFSSATVLISFGALIGKISPPQLLVMTVIEVLVSVSNEHIGSKIFKAADVGGSIFFHTFGAYFGLAVSYVIYDKQASNHNEETSKESDIFSMIGTLFLWMYWPSFNAIGVEGEARHRAVVNTYMALLGSCVSTFIFSSLFDEKGKLSMVHVQNATLAGGVAMGATADMMVAPWNALIIGLSAGSISVLGYRFLQPYLLRFNLHDTCGVHNLHGMPGALAGLISVFVAATATFETYHNTLYERYPGRAPLSGADLFSDVKSLGHKITPGCNWSAALQAVNQLSALGCTLAIATTSGLLTGFILRLPFLEPPETGLWFDDSTYWNVPDRPEELKTEIQTAPMTPQILSSRRAAAQRAARF